MRWEDSTHPTREIHGWSFDGLPPLHRGCEFHWSGNQGHPRSMTWDTRQIRLNGASRRDLVIGSMRSAKQACDQGGGPVGVSHRSTTHDAGTWFVLCVASHHLQRTSQQLRALSHSLCRVLFTFRSLYFCAIGSVGNTEAWQAISCPEGFHAVLSNSTTPRSGAMANCFHPTLRTPRGGLKAGTGLSPSVDRHHSR